MLKCLSRFISAANPFSKKMDNAITDHTTSDDFGIEELRSNVPDTIINYDGGLCLNCLINLSLILESSLTDNKQFKNCTQYHQQSA